ncbi:MAG: hypothetical protein QXH27_02150 [Candidatus Micrarchaeia archaeon]
MAVEWTSTQSAEKNCPPGKEFVFREPSGRECGRARNVRELFELIRKAPLSSVLFHANGSHYSPWLEMLGERELARRFRSVKGNSESVRSALLRFSR